MAIENYFNAWVDAGGNFVQTGYYWNPAGLVTAPEGLNPNMAGLSNAGFSYYVHAARQFDESTEPANALYPAVSQVLQMVFADASGSTAVISIPAPRHDIFLADGITLDTSNTDVSIFISSICIGSNRLYTAGGGVVTTFLRGFRIGRGTF